MGLVSDFGRQFSIYAKTLFPSTGSTDVLPTVAPEDAERFSRYSLFWRFYMGQHWENPTRPDGEPYLTANYLQAFVDIGTYYLMNKPWQLVNTDKDYSDEKIPYLDEIWKNNKKPVYSIEKAQMGGVTGDAFTLIMPDPLTNLPKSYLVPSSFVLPVWHPTERGVLVSGIVQFPLKMSSAGSTDVMTVTVDSMRIDQYVNGELVNSIDHRLGEPPLILTRNKLLSCSNSGVSDLQPVIDVQRQFNRKFTDIGDIINHHAAPITIVYGTKLKNLERGANKVWGGLPSHKEAKVENLNSLGDLKAGTEHLMFIQKVLHQLSFCPEIALGKEMDISNTSALAIQLLFGPLLLVTEAKHHSYGQGFMDENRIHLKWGIRLGLITAPSTQKELNKFYRAPVKFGVALPRDDMLNLNKVINRAKNALITPEEMFEELGVTNIEEYWNDIMSSIDEGTYPAMLLTAQEKLTNLGGVMRDGATNEQIDDMIVKESNSSGGK